MDVKQYLLNTSESELCSCEVPKKAPQKSEASMGFTPITSTKLPTGARLRSLVEAGQE